MRQRFERGLDRGLGGVLFCFPFSCHAGRVLSSAPQTTVGQPMIGDLRLTRDGRWVADREGTSVLQDGGASPAVKRSSRPQPQSPPVGKPALTILSSSGHQKGCCATIR